MKRLIPFLLVFVLHWTATWDEPTTCPCAKPRENPYNGQNEYPTFACAALCTERRSKEMARQFDARKDAEAFMTGCANKPIFGGGVSCSNFVLEEVHL